MWVERSAHAAPEASVRVVPCPVCSCEDIDAALSSVDTIWKVPRTVSHCRRCGLYFLDDMPSSDEIREWYNSDEAYAYGRIAGVLKQCFREFRSRSQHRYVIERKGAPAGGRVLEVGACEGRLLRLFRPSELVGLEYSVAYGTYAKRKFGIVLQPRDIFELDGAFDLIVMSHVLEHFPDIHRVMAKVKQLLRPGG
ncbi:MAG TPA: class I SAM-dependent methyltransferase, partial [Gemmatimonadaceae bacterium]